VDRQSQIPIQAGHIFITNTQNINSYKIQHIVNIKMIVFLSSLIYEIIPVIIEKIGGKKDKKA
jgi:hypothetical protein